MDDARKTKKIYQANLHQEQLKGRSLVWKKDDVENDSRKNEFVKWRQVAQDRDGWRRATREGLILLG